ncbi:type II secretion system F family protein [Streptomyces sp. MJP52]|uniref:type II secretion system F family protein n=1 Tax=Streptomyces sp. MJP52 TaxID=2940555 RepID=UPI002475ADD6|nr:type II secretion system F family protein [Streptomyces sp. MJP52]MDH6225783.1 tight adherence protein B [Streptomyces sp. MJP52]
MTGAGGDGTAGGVAAVTAIGAAMGVWRGLGPRSVVPRARAMAVESGTAGTGPPGGGAGRPGIPAVAVEAGRLRRPGLGDRSARRPLIARAAPLGRFLSNTAENRGTWWLLAAAGAVAVLGASPLPLALGLAAVPLVRRARRAAAERHQRDRRADAVIALCGALAGEVRAGRQPGEALAVAVRDDGAAGLGEALAPVVAAARFGGDVAGALTGASRTPGAEGLRGLAACWRVAVDRGAGLADGLERLDAALRAERNRRSDLRSQLAGARATTVMLAGLPAVGLAMGTALGADPLRILLHTGPGLGCLAVGGLLEAAGIWWALWIVRGAEDGS